MDKTQQKITHEYIKYALENNKRPASIANFSESIKVKESTFFKYFKSFDHLEKSFWKHLFEEVQRTIENQEVYASYSINEKLLAFYFTWIEQLVEYRSYAIHVSKQERIYELYPAQFDLFRDGFLDYAGGLIEEGLATEEIARRQMIADKYKYLLWAQPISIFKFWVKDQSDQFEDTDALIEKTVNFSFDLMRSNSLDSLFDLAKFHIQHF
jgi:hypothetical protein